MRRGVLLSPRRSATHTLDRATRPDGFPPGGALGVQFSLSQVCSPWRPITRFREHLVPLAVSPLRLTDRFRRFFLIGRPILFWLTAKRFRGQADSTSGPSLHQGSARTHTRTSDPALGFGPLSGLRTRMNAHRRGLDTAKIECPWTGSHQSYPLVGFRRPSCAVVRRSRPPHIHLHGTV